jgi:hypothetical protein
MDNSLQGKGPLRYVSLLPPSLASLMQGLRSAQGGAANVVNDSFDNTIVAQTAQGSNSVGDSTKRCVRMLLTKCAYP